MNEFYRIEESDVNSNQPNLIICLNSDAFLHFPPQHSNSGLPSIMITEDDDECLNRWLNRLGMRLANLLGLALNKRWKLKSFPKNYHLWMYVTRHKSCKRNKAALYGPYPPGGSVWRYRFFNSADEFILHLYWLCTHSIEERMKCECGKCTFRTQSEVKLSLKRLERRKQSERLKELRQHQLEHQKVVNKTSNIKAFKKIDTQADDDEDDDDDSFREPIHQESNQVQILFSSSQITQSPNPHQAHSDQPIITQASDKTQLLFPTTHITQLSLEDNLLNSRSKNTQASHKVLSKTRTKTKPSKKTGHSTRSKSTRPSKRVKFNTLDSSSLNPESSNQYQFSIKPIKIEPDHPQSHQARPHLINYDVIPSSLPQYRYLELVWYKLKKPIEIPSSLIEKKRSLNIPLWPSIVMSWGSKRNESAKPIHIKLLGIHHLEKSVFDHELLPWRTYEVERLRDSLRSLNLIDEGIEERMMYEDLENSMSNLSYAIQISLHLNSIISSQTEMDENDEWRRKKKENQRRKEEENYGNQIWLGAEVVSIGDFIILNEKIEDPTHFNLQGCSSSSSSSFNSKKDQKTCQVMLIGEIQESNRSIEHQSKPSLYDFKGHLFTILISKKRKSNQIECIDYQEDLQHDLVLQPFLENPSSSMIPFKRNSRSGYEFDLITDRQSGKKVKRSIGLVIGRMYSLNHFDPPSLLQAELIQNDHLWKLWGLKLEHKLQDRIWIPSRISAIEFAIKTAREEVSFFFQLS
ncbi:hypothetical protein DFH28DRAFT_880295 [Melampsora americana]|nr:hypothetical protein DFH28DRAFT_880295 [Melampsora americana]